MTPRLVLESGGPVGTVYELQEGENVVGRSAQAHVQVVASDVSRGHICIRVSGKEATVENLSRYGTTLDNRPIEKPVPLTDGQKLKLGRSTVLVFWTGEPAPDIEEDADATASLQDQDAEPPQPVLPPSSSDAIPSDEIPSDVLPSQSIPIDAYASDVHSSQPVGSKPDIKEAVPDIEEPLSGHIDFLDESTDDDMAEPLSMAGINTDDFLGRPQEKSMEPLSSIGGPGRDEDFGQEEEEDDDGPHTQMMSTRAIDYLRERQEQKARIRKISWIAGIAAAAALIVGLVLRLL